MTSLPVTLPQQMTAAINVVRCFVASSMDTTQTPPNYRKSDIVPSAADAAAEECVSVFVQLKTSPRKKQIIHDNFL